MQEFLRNCRYRLITKVLDFVDEDDFFFYASL